MCISVWSGSSSSSSWGGIAKRGGKEKDEAAPGPGCPTGLVPLGEPGSLRRIAKKLINIVGEEKAWG